MGTLYWWFTTGDLLVNVYIMSKISILHISDLHKPEGLNYETLLDSLCDDRERWRQEGIVPPSYIVISGDLIQGAYTDDDIQTQYNEVSKFLDKLVGEFLNGDKMRLIMVPGNHDMNRACSSGAMKELVSPTTEELNILKNAYWRPENMVRFDWKTMHFFKVDDFAQYQHRFDLYKHFYDNFYGGARTFPDDSVKEAFLYKFSKDYIAFAGFNSCNLLDDKNYSGDIDEEAITSISSVLRNCKNDGYLIIGVWHHHYYGNPYSLNYMSRDIFLPMAEKGMRIGLFGHQHISEVTDEYVSPIYSEEEQRKENTLLLISSGTLFGGEKHLQPGFRRQYNIIELERQGLQSRIEVSINIREDNSKNVNNKIPYWLGRSIAFSSDNKIHRQVYVKELSRDSVLLQISKDLSKYRDYEDTCRKLVDIGLDDHIVREMFDNYLLGTSNKFIIDMLLNIDITPNETLLLLEAVQKEHNVEAAMKLHANKTISNYAMKDSLIKDLYEKVCSIIS